MRVVWGGPPARSKSLLVVTVWLAHRGKRRWYVAIPMAVMFVVALAGLVQLVYRYGFTLIGGVSAGLVLLAIVLAFEGARVLIRGVPAEEAEAAGAA